MRLPSFRMAAAAVAACTVLTLCLLPAAQSQMRASPNFLPIGVAATGSGSTVWFHEPASGRALACQTVAASGGALSGIQCVSTKLPVAE